MKTERHNITTIIRFKIRVLVLINGKLHCVVCNIVIHAV